MSLLGALGMGIADAADTAGKISMAQIQSDIEEQKQARLLELKQQLDVQTGQQTLQTKLDMEAQHRQEQAAAIKEGMPAAAQGIVGNQIAQKYASSDAAVQAADAGQTVAPLTDEQKGIIADAKARDATAMTSDPDVQRAAYVQSYINSDYANPEKVMEVTSKEGIAQARVDAALAKIEQQDKFRTEQNRLTGELNDAKIAAMQAKVEKGAAGGSKTALEFGYRALQELGAPPDVLQSYLTDKKEMTAAEVATRLVAADPLGKLTPEQLAQKVTAIMAIGKSTGQTSAAASQAAAGGWSIKQK